MKKITAICIISLFAIQRLAATTLTGSVTDGDGLALPFATVVIKGTTIGTSANGEGVYTLELAAGSYSVTCQFMGYTSQTQYVTIGHENKTLNFQLAPQSLKISEVVVKADGEDPAYAIMRKVIAKRKHHADLIRTLETDVYLKGTLRTRSFPDKLMGISINGADTKDAKTEMGLDSNGKGIIYLVEELSHYSYKAPEKTYNKVISVRESGDPQGLGFASMPPITNIYENNINLLGLNERGFISPANGSAFLYYKYKFLGSYMEDGRMINKIQVIPRRKYEPLFSGYVYVVEDEWLFQSLELTLTRQSQMNLLDTLRLEQYFRPVAKDLWSIQSQILYPTLTILGFDMVGSFVTVYQHQKINQPLPEGIFERKIIAAYDSSATSRERAYWDTIRPIPLEKDEVRDYHFKDSIFTTQKKNEDSLNKIARYNLGPGAFLLGRPSIKINKNTWSMRPLASAIQFNSVEGLNATVDIKWDHHFHNKNSFTARWLNRYGFGNKQYNSLLKLDLILADSSWRGRYSRIGLSGGKYVYQINNQNPISPFMNELYTLLAGKNYLKLYTNRLLELKINRNWGNGLQAAASISYEQRSSLANSTDYTFRERHDTDITPNQPANLPPLTKQDAAIFSASIQYQPGAHYVQYPKYKVSTGSTAPVFKLAYTKAIPGPGNARADFDKWLGAVRGNIRLRMLGNLNYHIIGGGFFNKSVLDIPDWHHINGNRTFLANPYLNSFQLAPYYRFSNNADIYLEGHAAWHLGGLFTNKIPLFRRLNWFLVAGSNVLYINTSDYYAEVFIGLENIGWKLLRFGRVDLIAGYESGKTKPSIGVRMSIGGIFNTLFGTQNNGAL
jgi:hypothetical protein